MTRAQCYYGANCPVPNAGLPPRFPLDHWRGVPPPSTRLVIRSITSSRRHNSGPQYWRWSKLLRFTVNALCVIGHIVGDGSQWLRAMALWRHHSARRCSCARGGANPVQRDRRKVSSGWSDLMQRCRRRHPSFHRQHRTVCNSAIMRQRKRNFSKDSCRRSAGSWASIWIRSRLKAEIMGGISCPRYREKVLDQKAPAIR
jgi:hypothetical protein